METARSYSPLQRMLHWITALGVIIMIPVGLYMVRRGVWSNFDALTNTLYSWHKFIGFCILWLIVVRIIVRLVRGAPPPVLAALSLPSGSAGRYCGSEVTAPSTGSSWLPLGQGWSV